jgi:hypothetical protein
MYLRTIEMAAQDQILTIYDRQAEIDSPRLRKRDGR